MIHPISVIIIARDEARTIQQAVQSALLVSNDVIVADSGSADNTVQLAEAAGARVLRINWEGFGDARNRAAEVANHDEVLCLDADEVITAELAAGIGQLVPDPRLVYGFKRRNLIAGKEVKHGEWGHDTVYRIYNRRHTSWNLDKVHESIIAEKGDRRRIEGSLLHYTTFSLADYAMKLDHYAELSAEKFMASGKKPTVMKQFISPLFSFIKNYFFRLGFLDGKTGLDLAWLHAAYTGNKYRRLSKLHSGLRKH